MIYVIYKETNNFKSVPRIKPVNAPNEILKALFKFSPSIFAPINAPKKGPIINPIPDIKKIPIIKPSIEPLIAFLPPPNFFTP